MGKLSMKINSLKYSLIACIIAGLMWSCGDGKPAKTDSVAVAKDSVAVADTVIKGNFAVASGIRFDSSLIKKFIAAHPAFREFSNDFDNFYRNNKYNYAWYHSAGLIEFAHVLGTSLQQQQLEGLKDTIPYRDEYLRLMHHNDTASGSENTGPDINTELMLTAQYFNYAKKAFAGSTNSKVQGWYLPRKKLSYDTLLQANLVTENFGNEENRAVAPQHEGLKKALAQYREIEKNGKETKLPAIKKSITLQPGDSSDIIDNVRTRLTELGYINGTLIDAVKLFRQTHGMSPVPVIDNTMIGELNVPAHKRIEQIMVNLERLRWIPAKPESDEFILVNIPEFVLHYYENGKSAWDCRVVIGTPMTHTVIFSGLMQYIVFSPYWYVPNSIINKEIKPGMKRNPNYLKTHNMEWNGGQVRQKPGPSNSLGLVKFLFPNSNNIYLHDTPAKSLFDKDQRAFSHGCIRVAEPRELAIRILRQDSSWTPKKMDDAMHAGKEQWVTLKKKIPVYIGYFTAFIDKDGHLNFRKDIYNRDASLLGMLMK